jgi:hypothetical protein
LKGQPALCFYFLIDVSWIGPDRSNTVYINHSTQEMANFGSGFSTSGLADPRKGDHDGDDEPNPFASAIIGGRDLKEADDDDIEEDKSGWSPPILSLCVWLSVRCRWLN